MEYLELKMQKLKDETELKTCKLEEEKKEAQK